MSRLLSQMIDDVTCGDCIDVMAHLPSACIDFALTDPPYLVHYRDRTGRTVANDDNADWIAPAFRQLYRILKPDTLCLSFYGWNHIEIFMAAWKRAGFTPVGHIVFPKRYASSKRFVAYRHEQSFLLAKGRPSLPPNPLPDIYDDWRYTGNRLHPTQKPVSILTPWIESFTRPGQVVIDPFCGSGSTLAAARACGRRFIGIDMDPAHHATARTRLHAA